MASGSRGGLVLAVFSHRQEHGVIPRHGSQSSFVVFNQGDGFLDCPWSFVGDQAWLVGFVENIALEFSEHGSQVWQEARWVSS